jgi:hypothetical protein
MTFPVTISQYLLSHFNLKEYIKFTLLSIPIVLSIFYIFDLQIIHLLQAFILLFSILVIGIQLKLAVISLLFLLKIRKKQTLLLKFVLFVLWLLEIFAVLFILIPFMLKIPFLNKYSDRMLTIHSSLKMSIVETNWNQIYLFSLLARNLTRFLF